MKHVLFLCSQNRLRSPTAEQVFSSRPGFEVASAGLNHDAEEPVTPELLEWADDIFVMEPQQRVKLTARFQKYLKDKNVSCLDIPDNFTLMDPKLVELLERKMKGYFGN